VDPCAVDLSLENTAKMAKIAAAQWTSESDVDLSQMKDVTSTHRWKMWQEQVLLGVASKLSERHGRGVDTLTLERVEECCPGLSVGVRSLHLAWRAAVLRNAREAKPSDFVDAAHAMYAPYVDIFGADSFMAPHISSFAGKLGVTVVSKLGALPQKILSLLKSR
jgi:hypothetical protein